MGDVVNQKTADNELAQESYTSSVKHPSQSHTMPMEEDPFRLYHIHLDCDTDEEKANVFTELLQRYVAGHVGLRYRQPLNHNVARHESGFITLYGPKIDEVLATEGPGFQLLLDIILRNQDFTERNFESVVSWLQQDFLVNFTRDGTRFTCLCTYVVMTGAFFSGKSNLPQAMSWSAQCLNRMTLLYQRNTALVPNLTYPMHAFKVRETSRLVTVIEGAVTI